jgi:hypothetical protein
VHQRAAFLSAEIIGRRAAGVERAVKMDLHHRVEILIGHLVKEPVAQDAGVVHHRVDAAEFLDPGFDHRARGVGIGDVAAIGDRVAACGLDFLYDLLGRGLGLAGALQRRAQIVHYHRGAFRRRH